MSLWNRVSISGKIASGKTSVSDYLRDTYGYKQIRSAEYLKRICFLISKLNMLNQIKATSTGLTVVYSATLREYEKEVLFISKDKEEYYIIKNRLDNLREKYSDVIDVSNKNDRVREMLQEVANDLIDNVRNTIWVDSIIKHMENVPDNENVKFVHDDLRYPFEYDALRKRGFVLLRLDIDEATQLKRVKKLYGKMNPERLTHISEVALDKALFDYHISSEQSLEDMLKEIDSLIEKE